MLGTVDGMVPCAALDHNHVLLSYKLFDPEVAAQRALDDDFKMVVVQALFAVLGNPPAQQAFFVSILLYFSQGAESSSCPDKWSNLGTVQSQFHCSKCGQQVVNAFVGSVIWLLSTRRRPGAKSLAAHLPQSEAMNRIVGCVHSFMAMLQQCGSSSMREGGESMTIFGQMGKSQPTLTGNVASQIIIKVMTRNAYDLRPYL